MEYIFSNLQSSKFNTGSTQKVPIKALIYEKDLAGFLPEKFHISLLLFCVEDK